MLANFLRAALAAIAIATLDHSSAIAESEPTRAELFRTIKQLQARVEALERQSAQNNPAARTSRAQVSHAKSSTRILSPQQTARAETRSAEQSMAMAAPAHSWNGFYAGVSAGIEALRTSHSGTMTANPGGDPFVGVGGPTTTNFSSSTSTASSPLMGVRVGYDLAFGSNFVGGIQFDGDFSSLKTQQDIQIGPCSHPACSAQFQFNGSGSTSLDWTVSALARFGVASGDNLFYGLAGWSWAKFRTLMPTQVWAGNHSDFNFAEASFYANAPTFGLGWERIIYDGWSATVEYRYADFGEAGATISSTISNCPPFGQCTSSSSAKVTSEVQSVRVGLSRRFY